MDSIADPFAVLDHELRVIFMNEAAARSSGVERSAIIGKRPWDVFPETRESAFMRAYEECLRDRKPVVVEDYFAPHDRWFESTVASVPQGISVYTRDVTARRKNDDLTRRLTAYAELLNDVTRALDAEEGEAIGATLQRICEALVKHLGAAFARVWTLEPAAQAEDPGTLILRASAGRYTHIDRPHRAVPVGSFKIGLIASEAMPHLTNDVLNDPRVGNPAWAKEQGTVSFAGYPLLVDDRVICVMAMFAKEPLHADTTKSLAGIADSVAQGLARRKAEKALAARVEELARSNAEVEQFAYVASHDLQEPLRMVASYNQLLARRYKGKLDDKADEFIGFTVDGVTRMQRLLNDLLACSRVGNRSREHESVDLGVIVDDATKNLERAIADETVVITRDPLPTVIGDEGQLVQLFQNLLGNAIKFHGTAAPRVHIGARMEEGAWLLWVKDNGIGIDPEYFQRVFVIFQRLHPREAYPGTGIGLAICKKIVERHGGRIWVESAPAEGSTIYFKLPAVPAGRAS